MFSKRYAFIAHSGDAKQFVRKLTTRLQAAKVKVFVDEGSLEPCDGYDMKLKKAVDNCSLFIFVVSKASTWEKSYAINELLWAVKAGRKLLGVEADQHEGIEPPPEIAAVNYITGGRGDTITKTVPVVVDIQKKVSVKARILAGIVASLLVIFLAWDFLFWKEVQEVQSSNPAFTSLEAKPFKRAVKIDGQFTGTNTDETNPPGGKHQLSVSISVNSEQCNEPIWKPLTRGEVLTVDDTCTIEAMSGERLEITVLGLEEEINSINAGLVVYTRRVSLF